MYAYVLYADGGKAVVSTKLVKKFSPKHSADFDSESLKTVYWKSYGASADEGYYKARIQLLADTRDDLLEEMRKKHIAIPIILNGKFEVEDLSSVPQASDKKRKASADRVTIEEHARVIQKLKTAKQRVFNLEQELQVERSLSRRLQEQVLALLANNTQPASQSCPAEAPASTSGLPAAPDPAAPAAAARAAPAVPARAAPAAPVHAAPAALARAAPAAPVHAAPAALARAAPAAPARAAPAAPAHAAPAAPARAAPAAPARAALAAPDHAAPAVERDGDPPAADAPAAGLVQCPPEAPAEFVPLFADVGDRVHLGNGVLVRADKMAYIMGARGDSMFVKEAAKLVFGRENLQMRSVTGKPCRRFKGAMAKRALTPAKVEAVRNAFHKYVDRNPKEKSPSKRIALINHYLSELLQDINKKLEF